MNHIYLHEDAASKTYQIWYNFDWNPTTTVVVELGWPADREWAITYVPTHNATVETDPSGQFTNHDGGKHIVSDGGTCGVGPRRFTMKLSGHGSVLSIGSHPPTTPPVFNLIGSDPSGASIYPDDSDSVAPADATGVSTMSAPLRLRLYW